MTDDKENGQDSDPDNRYSVEKVEDGIVIKIGPNHRLNKMKSEIDAAPKITRDQYIRLGNVEPNGTMAIGLSSWIIQDGNYPDFISGTTFPFALEFYAPSSLTETSTTTESIQYVGDDAYDVVAKVIHATKDWMVIETKGLRMYRDTYGRNDFKTGEFLTGEIRIGVDPFDYFESFAEEAEAPALIYEWEIEAIYMETAPYIKGTTGAQWLDASKHAWKALPKTSAWKDRGGHAGYVLVGRRKNDKPVNQHPMLR